MIHTIKLEAKFARNGEAFLGTIPAGRILKSEPIFENGKALWLIEVETDPEPVPPQEIYSGIVKRLKPPTNGWPHR